MDSAMSLLVVLVTAPDEAQAQSMAETLLKERLVACVQILPGLASHYWWQGQLERSAEVLMILKAREQTWSELEQRVRVLHPFDVPQIVALPASHVESHYAQWVNEVTGADSEAGE